MSRSTDQRQTRGHDLAASAAPQPSVHPAKSVMDRRWEERRAAASARRAEVTSSVVLERAEVSGVQPTAHSTTDFAAPAPSAQLLLEDMRKLELKDAAESSRRAARRVPPEAHGPAWLGDTQRAMLVIAALSCSILLALLYFGGFLG